MGYDGKYILESIIRCVAWLVIFVVAMRLRSRLAKLDDADLSYYLTHSVFKVGAVGVAQLTFLVFAPVQCESEMGLDHPMEEVRMRAYGI